MSRAAKSPYSHGPYVERYHLGKGARSGLTITLGARDNGLDRSKRPPRPEPKINAMQLSSVIFSIIRGSLFSYVQAASVPHPKVEHGVPTDTPGEEGIVSIGEGCERAACEGRPTSGDNRKGGYVANPLESFPAMQASSPQPQ